MNQFWDWIVRHLGTGLPPEQLDFSQVVSRGLIIFFLALILMRVGHKRSLARKTAFDTAFVVIVGAVLARAVNGSSPFFPTIGVSCFLVFIHRLLSLAAFRWPRFENLLKGRPDILLQDGRTLPQAMRRHDISASDLDEDLHLRGHRAAKEISVARLERSGDISFVEK